MCTRFTLYFVLDPISWTFFFYRNLNWMEISSCSQPICGVAIAMKFCTWHDSCAAMACTKFCSEMILYNGVILKASLYLIWITMGKSFLLWFGTWQFCQTIPSYFTGAREFHDDVIKWKHFRVTGHLCGEFTGPRWIPHTKASDTELWCFLWSASE